MRTLVLGLLASALPAIAVPPAKGKPTCSGDGCTVVDVALGVTPTPPAPKSPESTASSPEPTPTPPVAPKKRTVAKVRPQEPASETNLPAYFRGTKRPAGSLDQVVFVAKGTTRKMTEVSVGDMVPALVEQSIKASPSVPTPVRALVTRGPLKGSVFVGEATLDRELKRVLIRFTKIRTAQGSVFTLDAQALSQSGQVGLIGEHDSDTGVFFLAEMASATAAGIADSTINRSQTAFGTFVQEPSLSTSTKQGAATALARTSDRLAEKVRSAPESTTTNPFQEIRILIQDAPKEVGG